MTKKYTIDDLGTDFGMRSVKEDDEIIVSSISVTDAKKLTDKLNQYEDTLLDLKQKLLFYLDVSTAETSSNYTKDMEILCQKLFKCSHQEAEEKYNGYEETDF